MIEIKLDQLCAQIFKPKAQRRWEQREENSFPARHRGTLLLSQALELAVQLCGQGRAWRRAARRRLPHRLRAREELRCSAAASRTSGLWELVRLSKALPKIHLKWTQGQLQSMGNGLLTSVAFDPSGALNALVSARLGALSSSPPRPRPLLLSPAPAAVFQPGSAAAEPEAGWERDGLSLDSHRFGDGRSTAAVDQGMY